MSEHKTMVPPSSTSGGKGRIGSAITKGVKKVFRRKKDDSEGVGVPNGHDSSAEGSGSVAPLDIRGLVQEASDYDLKPADGVGLGPRMGTAEYSSSVRDVVVSPGGGIRDLRMRESSKVNVNLTL